MSANIKKAAFAVFVVGMSLFILLLCLNTYVMGAAEDYILTAEQAAGMQADCVIVLGARVFGSGEASPVLRDRVQRGCELYYLGAGKKLLLSGDHGQVYYDEVSAMLHETEEAKVPGEDVFLDHAGFSTYETMVRAKEVFGAKRVVVVTQSFHLSRAVYIARAVGLDAYGVSSDLRQYMRQWYNELRELIARGKDWFYVLFRPDPKYLGEPIDISGSGLVTRD